LRGWDTADASTEVDATLGAWVVVIGAGGQRVNAAGFSKNLKGT
jgi:hypothetical protein